MHRIDQIVTVPLTVRRTGSSLSHSGFVVPAQCNFQTKFTGYYRIQIITVVVPSTIGNYYD